MWMVGRPYSGKVAQLGESSGPVTSPSGGLEDRMRSVRSREFRGMEGAVHLVPMGKGACDKAVKVDSTPLGRPSHLCKIYENSSRKSNQHTFFFFRFTWAWMNIVRLLLTWSDLHLDLRDKNNCIMTAPFRNPTHPSWPSLKSTLTIHPPQISVKRRVCLEIKAVGSVWSQSLVEHGVWVLF